MPWSDHTSVLRVHRQMKFNSTVPVITAFQQGVGTDSTLLPRVLNLLPIAIFPAAGHSLTCTVSRLRLTPRVKYLKTGGRREEDGDLPARRALREGVPRQGERLHPLPPRGEGGGQHPRPG